MQTHFETIQYNNLSMQNTITSKSLNFMSKLCQIAKHLQHHLLHTHTHTHTHHQIGREVSNCSSSNGNPNWYGRSNHGLKAYRTIRILFNTEITVQIRITLRNKKNNYRILTKKKAQTSFIIKLEFLFLLVFVS